MEGEHQTMLGECSISGRSVTTGDGALRGQDLVLDQIESGRFGTVGARPLLFAGRDDKGGTQTTRGDGM